jgi:hypothetical protein
MSEINLVRLSDNGNETIGYLYIDGRPACFTLEDEQRKRKVWGETRIPEGRYKLGLRTEGRFHERYSKRFEKIHEGMIQVLNVPGFEYILFHPGNTDEDTAGCILPGDIARNNVADKGRVDRSTQAYLRIYIEIKELIKRGDTYLNVTDLKREITL